MNIILCESADKQKYNAAKARKDVLKIAKDCGYRHITLFHNGNSKPFVALEIVKGCISTIAKAKRGDTILIQYPYSPMLLNQMLFGVLRLGKKLKGYKVSILIHDLNGLRSNDRDLLQKELKMMRGCNIIYHNESMRDECEKTRHAESFQILGLFDYLYSGETCKREYSDKPVIMIAGNLSPHISGFLYQIPPDLKVQFKIFGPNYAGVTTHNIEYCGKYPAEELIKHLDGQFGLIWYGNSCNTCDGNIGDYLPYVNPHKFSLYLAAGVPVIVWNKSALAEFVVTKNIGLAVESIPELKEKLLNIDERQYQTMSQNILTMRKDVVEGKYLSSLLLK